MPEAKRPGRARREAYNSEFESLFAAWRATGDPQLRDRMILMHRNLVIYLARRFLDRGELLDDIVQQGLIGLISALDHFDPERGVKFVTFATPTIVGEIRRYFRDKTWSMHVPRRMQELYLVIQHKIETLSQEFGRAPGYEEIARSLGLDIEDVIETLEMVHVLEPLSLDEPVPGEDAGGVYTLADQVGAVDATLEKWNHYAGLQAALDKLPVKDQAVLKYIYFEGRSQSEIARKMHVSQMYVSRAQRRALAKLRELMDESDP